MDTERTLDVADVADDPVTQFRTWYAEAEVAGQPEPEAMSVATVGADGAPSLRWVLLKAIDERGAVFYTNAHSLKGRQMAGNPAVALGWRWAVLDRQVRLTGTVTPVGPVESDAYFASRARRSQLGAWASEQSTVLGGRDVLESRLAEVTARSADGPVPRPPHWYGWRVRPGTVEFWQGRDNRLHDRIRYRRSGPGWVAERLSP